MKKLTILTLSGMLFITSSALAFSDFENSHWAYKNVMAMEEKGIISGFTDNTFRPDIALTREQFITMAVKGLGLDNLIGQADFEDTKNRWSEIYVKIAGDKMVDIGETTFRPEESALREDIAMAIVRLNALENEAYSIETLNQFSDCAEIAEGREKYVAIAVEHGFMSGNANGTFAPKKGLTRAEGATVTFNMLNKLGNIEESEEISANWDGEYISNIDGLVKVKLEKVSQNEVRFYIKGKKENLYGVANTARINGTTATYIDNIYGYQSEINFRFEDDELIIETDGYEELEVCDGRYRLNDGTVSTIEISSEKKSIEGYYWFDSLILELIEITPGSTNFSIVGNVNENLFTLMGTLQKYNNKWRYFDGVSEKYVLEIEVNENEVIVTGLTEDTAMLSGVYERKETTPQDEFKKYEELVDSLYLNHGELLF